MHPVCRNATKVQHFARYVNIFSDSQFREMSTSTASDKHTEYFVGDNSYAGLIFGKLVKGRREYTTALRMRTTRRDPFHN